MVAERTVGTCAYPDADTSDFPLVHIVGAEEYVVLAIFAQGGGSPHAFMRPFHFCGIYDRVVAGPVYKVF